jgi:isopenicillin N synthase-like dioxygenase
MPCPRLSVDLSPASTNGSLSLLQSATAHGYAHASNHGIPASTINSLFTAAAAFFASPPSRDSSLLIDPKTSVFRGYQPPAFNFTSGQPDAHHAIDYMSTLGPDEVKGTDERLRKLACSENLYPEDGALRTAVDDFIPRAVAAGVAVLKVALASVSAGDDSEFHLDEDSCERSRLHEELYRAFENPFWILRLIHYYSDSSASSSQPMPPPSHGEELGCGAHRDYGFITLLIEQQSAPGPSCLQVCPAGDGMTFVPVASPRNGDILVNFGDCLEAITDGVLPSTLHRVVRPPTGERIAIACFIEPNFNWKITPIMKRALVVGNANKCRDQFRDRLSKMQSFSCYGEYLLSKVSTNFVAHPPDTGT